MFVKALDLIEISDEHFSDGSQQSPARKELTMRIVTLKIKRGDKTDHRHFSATTLLGEELVKLGWTKSKDGPITYSKGDLTATIEVETVHSLDYFSDLLAHMAP